MQNKGSNWKFLVGAAAGAFIAYRSLKNSKPQVEIGKAVGEKSTAPQILSDSTEAMEAAKELTVNLSAVPENKVEYYFGHLPIQNFGTALIVALLFKYLGLGMTLSFLNDNASIDNVFAGGAVIAWSLIIYAVSLFLGKSRCAMRLFHNVLITNIKFFFDVALFASAFLVVKLLTDKEYSCGSMASFAFLLASIVGMNHLFLMLQGKDLSTVAAAKWLDKANPFFKNINVKFTPMLIIALFGFFSLCWYAYFSLASSPFTFC